MARPLRIESPGVLYRVILRGDGRRELVKGVTSCNII